MARMCDLLACDQVHGVGIPCMGVYYSYKTRSIPQVSDITHLE